MKLVPAPVGRQVDVETSSAYLVAIVLVGFIQRAVDG